MRLWAERTIQVEEDASFVRFVSPIFRKSMLNAVPKQTKAPAVKYLKPGKVSLPIESCIVHGKKYRFLFRPSLGTAAATKRQQRSFQVYVPGEREWSTKRICPLYGQITAHKILTTHLLLLFTSPSTHILTAIIAFIVWNCHTARYAEYVPFPCTLL